MRGYDLINAYFEWLCDLVGADEHADGSSYRRLLEFLHCTEFTWLLPMDGNRANDGVDLRYRFRDVSEYLEEPCSVLEMMVALAIRCEEWLMDDPVMGDRTRQWFWGMITSLGLSSMTDDQFDVAYVDFVVQKFLHREYEPNGRGGLFTIRRYRRDLRDIEIWQQLGDYINSIT